MRYLDPELALLPEESIPGDKVASSANNHALRTAPIITGDALAETTGHIFPQRALYGRVIAQHTKSGAQPDEVISPKLYVNTNTPFSALVCGVQVSLHPCVVSEIVFTYFLYQGSGKSHSTSVLLESCLISDVRIGTLPAPLSALVSVYEIWAFFVALIDFDLGYILILQLAEVSFNLVRQHIWLHLTQHKRWTLTLRRLLCSSCMFSRLLNVLNDCSYEISRPTYLRAMRRVYAGLPVRVEPLLFSPEDISGERLLAMMKIDDNARELIIF